MIAINYTQVPDEMTKDTIWHNGKCVMLNEGNGKATIYLNHQAEDIIAEDGETDVIITAFAVRMDTPVTRDRAINAAEMAAYGLRTAMDVASFNSALARKSRANKNDEEVKEHDLFIGQVKTWLDEIGFESR